MRRSLALVVLAAACVRHPREPQPQWIAGDGLFMVPERFAPGVVSGENVWKGSFTPDGDTLYYFRHLPAGGASYMIVSSHRQADGSWSAPARVALGGEFSDLYPAISPDGRRMVFTSYRPVPGEPAAPAPNASLWVVTRTRRGDWSEPQYLQGMGIPGQYHSQTGFDASGALYYRVAMPGERFDPTFVSYWTGRAFEAPVAYMPVNFWSGRVGDTLFVWGGQPRPDGRAVILEVSRYDSRHRPGPADLWITCESERGWTIPRPMPDSINTAGNENFVFFAPDAKRMYFVRDFRELLSVPAPVDCEGLSPGSVGAIHDARP